MRALALLLTAAGQACILGAIEVLGRRGLAPEQTRRLAHVAGAASVAVLPLFLSLAELGVLATFFTGVLAWTWRRRQLDSVHAVGRPTVGALVFPAGTTALLMVATSKIGLVAPPPVAPRLFVRTSRLATPVAFEDRSSR